METARAEVFRAALETKANASPHATVGPSQPHTAPRLPDPYSVLCALRRAAGRSATVGAVSLSRGTMIVELRAADPLDVLRRIESDPSVASAELERAGGREPDGRLPATVKVVYR